MNRSGTVITRPRTAAATITARPVVACHECDLLQREVAVPPGGVARCRRCGAELYRAAHRRIDPTLALVLAAAVLFAVANAFPIVGLEIQGVSNVTNLFGAVHALWNQEMRPIAVLVFLTTILMPATELAVMIGLLLPLKLGRRPGGLAVIMRVRQSVKPWGMVEVFMLGIIVALVKLTHFASVVPGLALWSFAILTLLMAAAAASFNVRDVWDRVCPAPRGEGRA